jgi:DMSO/TMAO reductase YedYZ molybdopterin-dependent catalytic subunit
MGDRRAKLVEVESKPFNAETPITALAEAVTPTALFYVRNNFDVPSLDAKSWRLIVDGLVHQPGTFSLNDLQRAPQRTLTVTLECAGNGRTLMVPRPPGTPWTYGAVGTAHFTGISLYALLQQAGIQPEAREVLFVGADEGEVAPGRREPFARSLSLKVAREADTLLAWAMNGESLTPEHGFPLRLVVPRWYGVASVKWLIRVNVRTTPFEGHFQKEEYVYEQESQTPHGTPVTAMRVRSIIARPADRAVLVRGKVEVVGTAWSGHGVIRRVEVSTNGGHAWAEAKVGSQRSPYAAVPWQFFWIPQVPGPYVLAARAMDSAGNVQPLDSVYNAHGYGNNVVHRIHVTVR